MLAGAPAPRRTILPATIRSRLQIPQLEDLAHAARAEPFDGLKPFELRQRVCRRRGLKIVRRGRPAVERHGKRPVALDERVQWRDEIDARTAEIRRREDAAVQHVLFNVASEERFEL